MLSRFSSKELFELRNSIPVDFLIKEVLGVPVKTSDGVLRFLCPICNEFHTAINLSTNLGRCFRCEKNFNPIDMVIAVKGMGFVESVNYLKKTSVKSSAHSNEGGMTLEDMVSHIGNPGWAS
jgi:hypothetical protein